MWHVKDVESKLVSTISYSPPPAIFPTFSQKVWMELQLSASLCPRKAELQLHTKVEFQGFVCIRNI